MIFRRSLGLRRVLAVLAGMMLLLAACGDDSGGTASGPALNQEDFVAAYSAICIGVDDAINSLDPQSLDEAKSAAGTARDIIDDAIKGLRALVPPADIADDAERGTDALAQTSDVFEGLTNAGSEEDFSSAGEEIDKARSEAQDVLGPLGIECESDEDSASSDDTGSTDSSGSDDSTSSDDSGSSDSDSSTDPGASGDAPDPSAASSIADYGNDAELDGLADACEGGDYGSCDDLFLQSKSDSSYEEYGDTCGGRNEPQGFCATIYG